MYKKINMDELNADELNADELNAHELNADEFNADELNADELNADELNADELNADELNIDELNSDELNSDELNTDELNIDELNVDKSSMNKFMEKIREILPNHYTENYSPEDYSPEDYLLWDKCSWKNADDLKLVKLCSDVNEEFAVFTIDDKILVFHYYDCGKMWFEIEHSHKNICNYDCSFYLFEYFNLLPADVISKILFNDENINELQRIWISSDREEIEINSSYKLLINYGNNNTVYIVKKNGINIFEYEDFNCTYTYQIITLYTYNSNLIIYSCDEYGGCIVIKNILN